MAALRPSGKAYMIRFRGERAPRKISEKPRAVEYTEDGLQPAWRLRQQGGLEVIPSVAARLMGPAQAPPRLNARRHTCLSGFSR